MLRQRWTAAYPDLSEKLFCLNSSAQSEVAASAVHAPAASALPVLRLLALVLLFSASAVYESTHLASLNGVEVWVHLRTGIWMIENHAIPHTGLSSQYSNLPWDDSTWGFDLLLGVAYRIFGLRALPLLLMTLKVSVAVLTFWLAYSGRGGFWKAVALSAIAQYAIWGLQPLPYFFSIFFFAVEVRLLFCSRYSGSVHGLYWLPLLFLVWANVHIQFGAGLILLAVFLIALVIEHWLRTMGVGWLSQRIQPLPLMPVSAIAALSLLATGMTPYGYRLLGAFPKVCYSEVGFQHFTEMSATTFRRPPDYLVMLLVMMAFLALGRRRSLELFELLMLLGATALAFRVQRDGWMVVLAAVAVLSRSSFLGQHEDDSRRARGAPWEWAAAAAATTLVLMITGLRLPDRGGLMHRVSQNYPAKACDYIAANKLPGPLFNEYAFGSFLTWYLPEYPVVVDSRVELYGDKILGEYFDIVGGKERLDTHPMIARARILLLEPNSAMAKALTNLPALRDQYRLVYSEELASVFVPIQQ